MVVVHREGVGRDVLRRTRCVSDTNVSPIVSASYVSFGNSVIVSPPRTLSPLGRGQGEGAYRTAGNTSALNRSSCAT